MIDVRITLDEEDRILECHIEGHARYDEYGYDIVCAAVSGLLCTTMLGLTKVTKTDGEYEAVSGFGHIIVHDVQDEKAQVLLKTMLLGLSEIERQYTKFIKIRTNRR